jgi:hypothetical protein
LENDRDLAVFAGQFVPLKIETQGETWGKWASKYRPEGNGIPIIYVIRADGEMLYGKSGSLRGKDLLNLIAGTLQKSGRSFNAQQLAALTSLVNQMKSGLENDDLGTAFQAIAPLSKIGEIGNLQSYSTVALEADQLVKQVAAGAEKAIAESQAKSEIDSTAFEGVVELVSAKHQLNVIPKLKQTVAVALSAVADDDQLQPYLLPAEMLARAERYASQNTKSGNKQAFATYNKVVETYAGKPAEKVARQRLAKLAANSGQPAVPNNDSYRIWTDITGKFKIDAKLLDYNDGKVRLQRKDGQIITLEEKKLSPVDRALLELEL